MTKKEMQPANAGDERSQAARDGAYSDGKNYTTDFALRQALGTGEENAVHAAELAGLLGVKTARGVRQIVNAARRRGVPVCSSDAGYFLPATAAELARAALRLRAAGLACLVASAHLRADALDGQMKIDDDEAGKGHDGNAQGGEGNG